MRSFSAELAEVRVAPSPARAVTFVAGDDPDAELVERWLSGDEEAFSRLVRSHEQAVFRLLYRMLGSREEAVRRGPVA